LLLREGLVAISKKLSGLALLSLLPLAACVEDKPTTIINGPVTVNGQVNNIGLAGPPQGTLPAQSNLLRGAESGKKQKFNQYLFVQPDCTSSAIPTVKIVKQPSHGTITVEEGEAYPNFPKDNVRSVCNTQKIRAALAYYTSEAGFTGVDNFALEVIYPAGGFTHQDYTMNVR
jgi:hypothetical protein